MSRVGKMPITVPSGVKVHVAEGVVRVEGPKGKLERRLDADARLVVESGTVRVERRDDSRRARSVHGLTRRLIDISIFS